MIVSLTDAVKSFLKKLEHHNIQHGELFDALRLYESTGYIDNLQTTLANTHNQLQTDTFFPDIYDVHHETFRELEKDSADLLERINQIPKWTPYSAGSLNATSKIIYAVAEARGSMGEACDAADALRKTLLKTIRHTNIQNQFAKLEITEIPFDENKNEPPRILVYLYVQNLIALTAKDIAQIQGWDALHRHNLRVMQDALDLLKRFSQQASESGVHCTILNPDPLQTTMTHRNDRLNLCLSLLEKIKPASIDDTAVTIERKEYNAIHQTVSLLVLHLLQQDYGVNIV